MSDHLSVLWDKIAENDYPYILIDAKNEVLNDPFIQQINYELLKIQNISIPDMYLREGSTLLIKYSEDIEGKTAKLIKMKDDYIKENYQIDK